MIVVTGANGQLGRALGRQLPQAARLDRRRLDLSNPSALTETSWNGTTVLINAAAYTKVDDAEQPINHPEVFETNVAAVAIMAAEANRHRFTLVHVSSEYVFDGSYPEPMPEYLIHSPLGVYGRSKALGDEAAAWATRHYIVRPSWVFGDGHNFIKTMARLAAKGAKPAVVGDQIGRPTLADDLAAGIVHLIESRATFGTYNLTGEGEPASWAEVAQAVFELMGRDPRDVTPITTAEYFADKPGAAQRPPNSVLDLSKIKAAGFTPRPWREALKMYLGQIGEALT